MDPTPDSGERAVIGQRRPQQLRDRDPIIPVQPSGSLADPISEQGPELIDTEPEVQFRRHPQALLIKKRQIAQHGARRGLFLS